MSARYKLNRSDGQVSNMSLADDAVVEDEIAKWEELHNDPEGNAETDPLHGVTILSFEQVED